MQPYFFPYAGYYRLISESDLFIIYDCVQFPRRGWLHRNKLRDSSGVEQWLTLPLVKQPQSVLIKDLLFPADARAQLATLLQSFPLPSIDEAWKTEVLDRVLGMGRSVVDYLEDTLHFVSDRLGLSWTVRRSSEFAVPDSFRGQDRIIEIVRRTGASRYLNAPGGVDLYDRGVFEKASLELAFLPPYAGRYDSMLGRVLSEVPEQIANEIKWQARAESDYSGSSGCDKVAGAVLWREDRHGIADHVP